jgi:HD-like signal output (HDOD) protein
MTQKAVWIGRTPSGGDDTEAAQAQSGTPQLDVRKLRFSAELESRIDHLPPFPTILSELIGLTNSEKSAATDLKGCLEKDPVLTARLLKLANSAFYSPRVPVTSIQQAVVMLGNMTVKSLAMAAATLKFLGKDAAAYGMGKGGLWMHSYACAELARHLALTLGWPDDAQDSVYVGALLHDIGKIVLADLLATVAAGQVYSRLVENPEPIGEWESRLTGFTHFGVGEKIAEKWRLAPLTAGCIRHHHVAEPVPAEFTQEVMLVSLADAGARHLGIGVAEPDEDSERENHAREVLGVSETDYGAMLVSFAEKGASAEEIFSSMGDMS